MKKIACILAALILAACANNPPTSKTSLDWDQIKANIPTGQVLIFVVRPANAAGSANLYRIAINGEMVADMPTDAYFSRSAAAGTIEVSANAVPNLLNIGLGLGFMGKPILKVKAEPGDMVFLYVDVDFFGGPKLSVVSPGVGEHLVQDARKKM
jgi:hypothetical protein